LRAISFLITRSFLRRDSSFSRSRVWSPYRTSHAVRR
jgi:hypothetical protein